MPSSSDITALEFEIDIDGRAAQGQILKIKQAWETSMGRMKAATAGYDKQLSGVIDTAEKFGVEYSSAIEMSSKQLNTLNAKIEDTEHSIKSQTLMAQQATKEERKGIEKTIDGLKSKLDLYKKLESKQGGANYGKVLKETSKEFGASLRKDSEKAFKGALEGSANFKKRDMVKGMSGAFQDAAGSLKSKDFGGMLKGLGGMIGAGAKGLGGMATRAGMRAQDPASGAGGISKALGGMLGKMGPMIETVAKLGPILGAASGAIMAIVKLFLDAEAAAKEFNKEILASASTGEFLAKNGRDATLAFSELDETLESIRNSAFSLENIKWGITSKDHAAFLNTLTAEGVSLSRIGEEAKLANKEVGAFSADMVHVGIAYSRNFGVSLQEITSFQSEMMTELGSSFSTAEQQFSLMANAAGESGIAQNKFFNIIKSVSSDLSLYNMRLEDSVQLLSLLGKSMNPRNAQKFLQETMQGFKNMGRTEKLQLSLLAGKDAVNKALNSGFAAREQDAAKKIKAGGASGDVKDIQAAVAKGGAAAEQYIKQLAPELQGSLREALTELDLDKKGASKGDFGKAMALGNMDIGGVLDVTTAALKKLSGAKDLESGYSGGGVGFHMTADKLGISDEKLKGYIKLERAIKAQRKVLLADAKTAEEAKNINEMGSQGIIQTMSELAQKELKGTADVKDYAKQQSDLTSSILDKLGTIMDFLLNEFYNVMTGIWDTIMDIPGLGGHRAALDTARAVRKTKDKDIVGAYHASGGDMGEMKRILLEGTIGSNKIKEALYDQPTTEEGKKAQEDLFRKFFSHQSMTAMSEKDGSMEMAGIDPKKIEAFNKALFYETENAATGGTVKVKRADVDPLAAMKGANFTSKEIAAVASKTGWAKSESGKNDPAEIMKMFPELRDAAKAYLSMPAASADSVDNSGTMTAAANAPGYGVLDPGKSGVKGMGALRKSLGLAPDAASTAVSDEAPLTGKAPLTGPGTKKDEMPATTKQADKQIDAIDDVHDKLDKVKVDKTFLKNQIKPQIADGVLDSLRIALYEYWMYSGLDKDEALKKGYDPKDFGKELLVIANKNKESKSKGVKAAFDEMPIVNTPTNAAGGMVLNPAPGEVLASVAPGETIIPKGGSKGGTVHQTFATGVDSSFAKYIEGKTKQAIIDWERSRKLR